MEVKQYAPENQLAKEKIKRKIKKYLETNENVSIKCQNLWNVLWGKSIAINAYVKKQERTPINNLTLHLLELEKEQMKPKLSTRKETTKIRAEVNKIEIRKTTEKINKTKS